MPPPLLSLQDIALTFGTAPLLAGAALLSGLMVCGRCGSRMVAAYSNAGHAARCLCGGENSSYGGPFCQSLKAAPVDGQVTSIVLQAL